MRKFILVMIISFLTAGFTFGQTAPEAQSDDPELAILRKALAQSVINLPAMGDASKNQLIAIETAISTIFRHAFAPTVLSSRVYGPLEIPLGANRILPPVADIAVILKEVQSGKQILIIGQDSGYLASLCIYLGARVTVVESIPDSIRIAKEQPIPGIQNLQTASLASIPDTQWDLIVLHGSVRTLPDRITSLVANGGSLFVPYTGIAGTQILIRFTRTGNWFESKLIGTVRFPELKFSFPELW